MSEQVVPRFGISIRKTFSNTISLPVTNEYNKGAVMQISTVIGRVYHLLFKGFSETGLFRHLSKHVFRACNFGNTKAVTVLFDSKGSKFNRAFKNAAKILKKRFSFLR